MTSKLILIIIFFPEPTDAGIIPPQFRKPHHVPSNSNTAANHIPVESNSAPEKKQPHQWSSNPVEEWAKEQVKIIIICNNFSQSRPAFQEFTE